MKKIRVVGCGGAGLNIAQLFEPFRGKEEEFSAMLDVAYIDTSKADLKGDVDPNRFICIDNVEGSGGVRAENAEKIREAMPAIYNKLKPVDLNVIICSLDGGSGNMLAAYYAAELHKHDANVICILVGNTTGKNATRNTILSLKSFDGIAAKSEAPSVAQLFFNSPGSSVESVNRDIKEAVLLLALLFSNKHGSVDARDLYNWLHFDQVTEYDSGLALLNVVNSTIHGVGELKKLTPVASMITLGATLDERHVLGDEDAEYHKAGILVAPSKYQTGQALYFAITTHQVPSIVENLAQRLEQITANAAAVRKQKSISSGSNDDGIVL